MLTRRTLLRTTAASAAAERMTAQENRRVPNIVFVMTDDQRWDEMGCAGHPFLKTPNIDRLAREGAMFQNCFGTTPLCAPARASVLTGQYAHTHGILDNSERGPQSHLLKTYPQLLQGRGYETAFLGKLHMGNLDDSPRPGFDYWLSFKGQGRYDNPVLNRNGRQEQIDGYLTDILNREAVAYLRTRRSKPFALCVWHKAVHDPTVPAERHRTAYAGESIPRRPNVTDLLEGKPALPKPAAAMAGGPMRPGGPAEEKIRNQMRCLLSVDEGVGQMYEALAETGQLDNTLFVYSSDNGYFWGEHRLGDKRRAYEEGLRLPLLMRYPALIAAGARPAGMAANIDLAPTFLEAAGATIPGTMQGRSLLPLVKAGRNPPPSRTRLLTEYFSDPGYPHQPWQSIRTERWKYIHYTTLEGADELYDLKADPYELRNLVHEPGKADALPELRRVLVEELRSTGAEPKP